MAAVEVGQVAVGDRLALVDRADLPMLCQISWYLHHAGSGMVYARNRRVGYMHRVISRAPAGISVDHENCDGLDNRRANLRVAGQSMNTAHARTRPGRSGYRGVHWRSRGSIWQAQIKVDYQKHHLGTFADPEEAARAYDRAALAAFGEFARLNFPEDRRDAA